MDGPTDQRPMHVLYKTHFLSQHQYSKEKGTFKKNALIELTNCKNLPDLSGSLFSDDKSADETM